MRIKFDEQLTVLNFELTAMGDLVEKAIAGALEALRKHDLQSAKQAIAFDAEIDEKEKEIESICLKLLLHQQPVAHDLKTVSAALKMITDMERIGDMATDISEITMTGSVSNTMPHMAHIEQMEQETIQMVKDSIRAFVEKNAALAQKVIDNDDIVDLLFVKVKKDLITTIKQDISTCDSALDFLMIAKYLERIGDHATNIAEWVLFSVS